MSWCAYQFYISFTFPHVQWDPKRHVGAKISFHFRGRLFIHGISICCGTFIAVIAVPGERTMVRSRFIALY